MIIKAVNFTIPGDSDDFVSYSSTALLSDADLIVFQPSAESEPNRIHRHWKEELKHVLNLGKTVIVLLTSKAANNYDFLPDLPLDVISASGSKAYPKSKLVDNLEAFFENEWSIEAYLRPTEELTSILFSSKNNDRIFGAHFKLGKGNLLLIPNIKIDEDNDFWEDDEWTQEGNLYGKKVFQQFLTLYNNLNSSVEESIAPIWVDLPNYQLKESIEIKKEINKNNATIEALNNRNADLTVKMKVKELLKGLLFEQGKPLETSVIYALQLLGYTAENFDNGILELDQIITSPEGDRFVGECEGKDNKHIDINKFRQLQDGIKEDFEREEVEEMAYGILFGNPQRLLNPVERTLDFTEKCKKAALREKIGLINTIDLFEVSRYLLENEDKNFMKLCRNAIKEQLGEVIKFPSIPS